MARTLLGTGIAPKLIWLVGLEPAAAADSDIQVYASVDSAGTPADNHAAVQAAMTVDAAVTESNVAWVSSINQAAMDVGWSGSFYGLNFGATKPHIKSATGRAVTFFVIFDDIAGTSNVQLYQTSGTGGIGLTFSSGQAFWQCGGTNFATTKSDFAASAHGTLAWFHDPPNTNDAMFWGDKTGSLAVDTNYSINGQSAIHDCDITTLGNNGSGSWGGAHGKIIMAGAFVDDYGVDTTGKANRLAALQGLHNDPYGALFASSVTGGGAAAYYSRRRR